MQFLLALLILVTTQATQGQNIDSEEVQCPFSFHIRSQRVPLESIVSGSQLIDLLKFAQSEDVLKGQLSSEEIVTGVNLLLEELNLPKVDNDYSFKFSTYTTFLDNLPIGIDVRTENLAYCFPCEIDHNDFVVGIIPRGVEVRKPSSGPYLCEIWKSEQEVHYKVGT